MQIQPHRTLKLRRAFTLLLVSCSASHLLAADFVYTVQPGDHPWNLAQRYLKNPALALALRQHNHIPDERHIPPGTRLRIPNDWLRLESAQVRVAAVVGETRLVQGQTPARPPQVGELLQAPSALQTGATGSASLEFADGSRVLVRRDTELQLRTTQQRSLGKVSMVELELLQGSLENQVTPMGTSGGRFEIRTPGAIAAVRGTQFRVHAQQNSLRTEVIEGAVKVSNAAGQVTASAAQGSVAQAGQAPGQPTALLPAPNVGSLPERIERLPIDWPLPAIAGASSYRTQLAPGNQFLVAASDETSPAPRIRARDVEDGNYVLRVRAIDAQGLEGLSTERSLVVHARPEPPLLIEPAADGATTAARPNFRWTQADPSWRYRLQIMAEGNPAPLAEQELANTASATAEQDLQPGVYRWRVAAIHPEKGQGPWGDAQGFRRVLPGPGVDIAPPKDGTLTLRWTAQPQTAQYKLQVARDTTFASPLTNAQTDKAEFTLQDLAPGVHYVRVQAIGDDGYTGPWGSTQSFSVPEAAPSPWRALLLLIPLLGAL
jgi:hypothetical protein